MNIWFNLAPALDAILRRAAAQIDEFESDFDPRLLPADPRFGDFQANGILPFARRIRTNPRALATKLVEAMEAQQAIDPNLIGVEIAGPGFINFRLLPAFLLGWLQRYRSEDELKAAAGRIYRGRTIVIDFSSPNTVKQLHVGHIRTTIIGESLSRLLEFCGARVIRDNHLGDWGTQFGILIMAVKRSAFDLDEKVDDPLDAIENLYREGNEIFERDERAREEARAELVKLQDGDPENIALWKSICRYTYAALQAIYDLLDVRFDYVYGESFYRDQVDRVYCELQQFHIAEESRGALVVFHRDHPRFNKQPFIVRKSDGASNYSTTDLATVLYRVEQFAADAIHYVVDPRQSDHFEQLFLTSQKWLAARGDTVPELKHIKFGMILGEGGSPIKTRQGEPIKLKDLLNEAVDRAYGVVSTKNPDLPDDEKQQVARTVGIAAVKYADLAHNRTSDYVFSWDKLLSLEGNTAPYLLYAVARIYSIFRNAGLQPGEGEEEATAFETDTEAALAAKLVAFVNTLSQTLQDLRPHILCSYLFELAGLFSTFYNADRVITDDPAVRSRRLLLCASTLRTLETGLHILSIPTLQRM